MVQPKERDITNNETDDGEETELIGIGVVKSDMNGKVDKDFKFAPNYCHIIIFMGVMIASGASFIYGQVIANGLADTFNAKYGWNTK